MKIYFAAWLVDKSQGRSLTKKKAGNRLISFHFLKEHKISFEGLAFYIRTGRNQSK